LTSMNSAPATFFPAHACWVRFIKTATAPAGPPLAAPVLALVESALAFQVVGNQMGCRSLHQLANDVQ